MKVEVRPLPETKWHGKKGKDSFAQAKTVEVLYDSETGKYATGIPADKVEDLGREVGADLSDRFISGEAHPYFGEKKAWIVLENRTLIFDTNRAPETIKVYNMKASKLVANSLIEAEKGLWPDATHYIFDESEEVEAKAVKSEVRKNCYRKLDKMTEEDKVNIIQILSKKSLRGRTANFINVEIDEIIEEKPVDFLRYVSMGREEVAVRAAVLECIYRDILSKEGGSIFYMGEMIGVDLDASIEWFKDVKNNKLRISIFEKLINPSK